MQYLILFAHRHVDFRLPELDVLLEMQGLNPEVCYDRQAAYDRMKANPTSVSPLLSVQLPSEQHAIILAERGVLVRAIYEFFAIGSDYNSLISELQGAMPRLVPFATSSWRLDIEAFGRRFSMTEQTERRELVKPYLIDAFPGPVKMKDPNEWFLILEEYAVNTLPHELLHVYFVRTLAGNYRSKIPGGSRALVHTLTLKKRAYIGPTSMDTELALIMANMGQVTPCDFVLDPFVGTGSILIPCAAFGAFTFGTDIDIRILRGKKGKNLFSNFAQYKLPFPELLRSDTSRPNWYGENIFDAIICDPPYGIRAGARKSGCPIEELKEIPEEFHESHIPKTQCYEGDDMMHDLLQLAATALKPGGRLVYLIPTPYDFENSDLPTHPNLKFIASSEQGLSTHVARRLVTMEKRLILSNAPAPRTCRLFQKLREIRTAL